MPLLRGRELAGLARFPGALGLAGGDSLDKVLRGSRESPSERPRACGALRAAVRRRPGWKLPTLWPPCEMLALPPGPADEHVTEGARQLSCGHPLLMMDHRIVAWAPGSDGLVVDGRAPASGTAARAPLGFGCSANPAVSTGAGSTRAGMNSPAEPPGRRPEFGPGRGRRANPTLS